MKAEYRRIVEQLLTQEGFQLVRQSGHAIYAKGAERVVLSRDKLVSPGVMRKIKKSIDRAKQ